MDTRIATPLFELVLPGTWARSTPEAGLTVFRSPSGGEQLSISSVKVREPLADVEQQEKLQAFVRVRRDAELRMAPRSTLANAAYFEAPRRAMFTGEDTERGRRSATFVLVREAGFVVLYLESIGGDSVAFEGLVARLSLACASLGARNHSPQGLKPEV